jgi:alpha-tubulin suppressor-like RCC1 family protein
VEQVVAGGLTTCVRTTDGSVLCFGAQWVGDPERAIPWDPQPEPQNAWLERPATRLVAGGETKCAFDAAGRAACWSTGEGLSGGVPEDLGEPPVVVAPSDSHVCVLHATGEVACRGDNNAGQLGAVGYHDGTRPVEAVGLADATRVVVGEGFSAALRSDGRVVRWGRFNDAYGGEWSSPVPVEVAGIDDATAIAAGRWHVCALRRSGTVACWGDNQAGQLGDGTSHGRLEPVSMVGVTDATALATADRQTCALLRDGRVTCTSDPSPDGTEVQRDLAATGVRQIVGNWSGIYTLHDDGQVLLWSVTADGTVSQPMPGYTSATSLDLGVCIACARWADGSAGCLFPPNESWICQPDWAVLEGVRALGPVAEVAPGARHVCVRLPDGSVACAGESTVGQLGRGTYEQSNAFAPVEGLADAIDVDCGEAHCCAVRASGHVACWGANHHGQLGDGAVGTTPWRLVRELAVVPGL